MKIGDVMGARRITTAIGAAVLLLGGAVPVATQGQASTPRGGWVMGGSLGAVGPERLASPTSVTVGAHRTQLASGRLRALGT